MLTQEEFNAMVALIYENGDDQGKISELLADLKEVYGGTVATVEILQNEIASLKENNASLVKANGELFLKVGLGHVEQPIDEEETVEIETLEDILDEVLDERGRFI